MRKYLFTAVLAIASVAACKSNNRDTSNQPAPDNSARNSRDRAAMPVADQAISAPGDLDLTQKIRKGVVDDGSLSMDAHNCKIIVNNGVVTLDGPVKSTAERDRVQQIAMAVVGTADKIDNKLEVVTN